VFRAAEEYGVRILLVGQPQAIRSTLASFGKASLPIEIVPASEVITMEDHPAQAFRRKKDSSVHVAAPVGERGQGGCHGERREYRRGDDHGEVHHGHAGVSRSCGAGRSIPECQGAAFPCCWMSARMSTRSRSTCCSLA